MHDVGASVRRERDNCLIHTSTRLQIQSRQGSMGLTKSFKPSTCFAFRCAVPSLLGGLSLSLSLPVVAEFVALLVVERLGASLSSVPLTFELLEIVPPLPLEPWLFGVLVRAWLAAVDARAALGSLWLVDGLPFTGGEGSAGMLPTELLEPDGVRRLAGYRKGTEAAAVRIFSWLDDGSHSRVSLYLANPVRQGECGRECFESRISDISVHR